MLETLLKKSNQSKAIFAQRFTVPRFPLFYVEFCFILADIYNILRSAQKQLSKINAKDQDRIIIAIRRLSDNPRPTGCLKLSGRPAWRIRVGDYRIIYEIHTEQLLITVITIGHRREVYR
jgi:mRNA interferase RelE/StbE